MSCNKYQEYIIPYAEGTLSTDIMEEMAAHLFACPECRRELDEIIDTIGILKETEYPQMEPAVNLRSRVLAQIADELPVRKPWWRMNLTALSAAAGLMFICVFIVIYSKGGAPGSKAMQMEEAIQSTVVSSASPTQQQEEKLSESLITTGKAVQSGVKRLNSVDPGGVASAIPHKLDTIGNKSVGTRKIDKPVMMAKTDPSDRFKDIEADQIRIEKSGSFEDTPLMAKPMDSTKEDIAKQRAIDDRQAFNAMVPGGAQNQQQNAISNMSTAPEGLQDNTSKSGFTASKAINGTSEPDKRIANEILTQEQKLAAFPNSITVMKKLLEGYRASGRADDEYAIAVKLTQVDPNNAEYWFARGQAAERMKMPKTAVTCYQIAIRKNLSGANLELAKGRLQALGSK
ncbi:MAG: zf-HC2 domain-containing protein [Armatimonadota bacterium]